MKNLYIYLIIGILIRLVLASITFHPDIQAFNLSGQLIASGHILNLYDYLANLSTNDPVKNIAVFNYPPAIYLFHGLFNFLFNIFGLSQINQFLLDMPSNYGNIQFNIHLLLLKLPYLIFDILLGLVLIRLFNSERESKLAFLLWMINPLNLYSTYMMGQFDIIPTFFTLLSLFFMMRKKLSWAALALGAGIAFKIFPIFLIVPLIILGKNLSERVKLIILAALPYLLSILPYLPSANFRSTALLASQSSKSLYATIPVSGGEAIILFPTALILIYLLIWQNRHKQVIWKTFLIILLLFFILTHYHPQWLIWVTPFLIISLVLDKSKNLLPVLLILISWLGSLFFFDPSLTLGFFSPIVPILHNSPSIWTLLHLNPDYNFSRSVLQTIFASGAFYLIYTYLPTKGDG